MNWYYFLGGEDAEWLYTHAMSRSLWDLVHVMEQIADSVNPW